MISVIIPTYNEAGSIEAMISAISQVLQDEGMGGEIIVVDDDSPDGTSEIIRQLGRKQHIRLHVRKKRRGLATAVMKGLELANGPICVVMDADQSHPADKIPEMVALIVRDECDVVIGSRWTPGEGTRDWPLHRKFASKAAGMFAKGLTRLSDPTSGFFAIRKDILSDVQLDPVGWKIALEIIVKTNCRYKEVPIVFESRRVGRSKLDFTAQRHYIHHLWRLYVFKYNRIFRFLR